MGEQGARPAITRILIVGHGSAGKRHLRLARQFHPNANIRVLRHRECDLVPEFADGCFFDLQSALHFAPEIAIVANPASFHMGAAIPLAECGAHLLIEKPLADSIADIPRLIELCERKKRVLMTGYNLRFLPSLIRFRDLVHGGELIGRVVSIRCEIGQYLPNWRPESDYRTGVSARKALGGGALLELSHEIDYLRWIFGEVAWVKASLLCQSDLEIDVEDTAHLILCLRPPLGTREVAASVNMDFLRHDTTRLCTAIGTSGTMRWNGLTGQIELFRPAAERWFEVFRYQHGRDDSYIAEWKHFLSCVNHVQTPLVSGMDGLRVLETIEAIRGASASGCAAQVKGRGK